MKGIIKKISFNRSIKLTRDGIGFILLTLAAGTAAINTGNNLLYLILAAMLSFIIVSGILSEWCLRGIEIERRLPQHIFASIPFSLMVRIINKKRFLSSFSLVVREIATASGPGNAYLFRIPPRHTSHTSYTACFKKRGRQILKGFVLSTLFPFGFFNKSLKRILPGEVIIYPRIDNLTESLKEELFALGNIAESRGKGRGTTLYNIRDYRAGEDSRAIHWKSSARQSKLMIKEFEREEERMINLFLSNKINKKGPVIEADLDLFERGIEITAALANYFLRKNFSVGLFTFDKYILPGLGIKHLYGILEELALLDINNSGKDYPEKESDDNAYMRLTRYNGTNILILPWNYSETISMESLFSKILRVGIDA